MKKIILFTGLLAVTLLLNSCVKQVTYNPDESPEKKLPDMIFPQNFNWSTSKSVTADFTSKQHSALVYVSMDKSKTPFGSFFVGEDIDQIKLCLPKNKFSISVQYLKADDVLSEPVTIDVVDGKAKFVVPNDSKAMNPETQSQTTKAIDDKPGTILIPSTGVGTLMFEDLWPSYGDYDFNDMVINYNIRLGLQNKNNIRSLTVNLRVNAVGGSIPFNLFLQLDKISGAEIDLIVFDNSVNTVDKPEMILLNDDKSKSPARFLFKGITKNANDKSGISFLNTVKGFELTKAELVDVQFTVFLRNAIKIEDLDIDNLNFYIGMQDKSNSNQYKEIHLGGFAPTELGIDIYNKLKAGNKNIDQSTRYYYSNSNLIWALNIPDEVPHVYENTPFNKAYPKFAEWAQSSGVEHQDWYESGQRDQSLVVNK